MADVVVALRDQPKLACSHERLHVCHNQVVRINAAHHCPCHHKCEDYLTSSQSLCLVNYLYV